MNKILFSSLLVIVCCSYGVSAGEPSSPTPAGGSGIEGVISVGPVQGGPVRQGDSSARPAPNMAFEVKQEGRIVGTFTTDDQGHFRMLLPAGHYTVSRKDYASAIGSYGPFSVDVSSGKMTDVHWECDTGLR